MADEIKSDADIQMWRIRMLLGLNPVHDPSELVRVLYEEGREAFEKLRGEPCAHAHEWKPRLYNFGGMFITPVSERA